VSAPTTQRKIVTAVAQNPPRSRGGQLKKIEIVSTNVIQLNEKKEISPPDNTASTRKISSVADSSDVTSSSAADTDEGNEYQYQDRKRKLSSAGEGVAPKKAKKRRDFVPLMDVPIKLSKEECAFDMGRRLNYAAVKDAQIELRKVECALGMGQSSNYAAAKDAQIESSKEECV